MTYSPHQPANSRLCRKVEHFLRLLDLLSIATGVLTLHRPATAAGSYTPAVLVSHSKKGFRRISILRSSKRYL